MERRKEWRGRRRRDKPGEPGSRIAFIRIWFCVWVSVLICPVYFDPRRFGGVYVKRYMSRREEKVGGTEYNWRPTEQLKGMSKILQVYSQLMGDIGVSEEHGTSLRMGLRLPASMNLWTMLLIQQILLLCI